VDEDDLTLLSINEYFTPEKSATPNKIKEENFNREFKCDLWVTNNFPVNRNMILTVIKILN
jgi:hypothetical protein